MAVVRRYRTQRRGMYVVSSQRTEDGRALLFEAGVPARWWRWDPDPDARFGVGTGHDEFCNRTVSVRTRWGTWIVAVNPRLRRRSCARCINELLD